MHRTSRRFCDNRALSYDNNSYYVGKHDFRKLVSILMTRALFINDDALAPILTPHQVVEVENTMSVCCGVYSPDGDRMARIGSSSRRNTVFGHFQLEIF